MIDRAIGTTSGELVTIAVCKIFQEAGAMSDIEVIFSLPEALVKEATALGILTNAHLEALLRADIQAQLVAMASDPAIRREIADIQADFAGTDYDGLDTEPIHSP